MLAYRFCTLSKPVIPVFCIYAFARPLQVLASVFS